MYSCNKCSVNPTLYIYFFMQLSYRDSTFVFQHRTLHRQYHTPATRPSEHQTTQAQTIKTSTTCVMQVGTPLVLQPKQLSSICRIAVVTHQYNITNTNAGKLHHPKVVSTTQLPVYLTTTSHKTTLNTTLTTSTTHHLFGNRTPALRSASTTTYVQHTSITEHTSISTFLPTFSQTPQQHYPAGHTLPHSMQPQCATAAFRQPFAPTPQQQPQQLMGHTVPQPTQAPFANSAFTPPLCFQHTTSQHSHAMSSATTTLQCSHTQSSALTTTIWIIRHLPVYTTVNKHNTSTTSTSHAIFTAISTTTASTPPLSHNKHSRTRSRTTRKKHRSTTRRRRRHRSTNRHCFFGILADWFFGQARDLILYLIYSLQTTSLIRSVSTPKKFGLFAIWFRHMAHKTNSAEGSFSSHSVQNNHTEGSCSWKNRVQRLDIRLSGNLGSKRTSNGIETSCPSGLLCVRNPESKGKAGGPWTHRWHGPTKTHLCRRENVPASEMARWPSQKPPTPTCHDMTWHDMLM